MTWSFIQVRPLSALLLATSLGWLGCGASGVVGAGAGGGGNPNGDDANAWIVGDWSGTFALKDDDDTAMSATAKFEVTEDRSGTFSIVLPDNDGATTSGRFQDFAGETLVLDVKTSNISSIGSEGTKSNVDYDLIGNSLKLQNERMLLRLVRDKADDGDDDGDVPDPVQTGLIGHWGCLDLNGYDWAIQMKSETEFSADVSVKSGGRAPIWLDGSVVKSEAGAEFDARLTVTDSDVEQYKGLALGFKQTATDLATLTRIGDEPTVMKCTRTK